MSLTLDALMQSLAYGELATLSMTNDGEGSIRAEEQPRIMAALNSTLQRLGNQYVLERRKLNILIGVTQEEYILTADHIFSVDNPNGYLEMADGGEFDVPIGQILKVYLPGGVDVPQNDPTRYDSVHYTASKLSLDPAVYRFSKKLIVEYRPLLVPFPLQPTDFTVKIPVPPALHGALQAGIASVIFAGMAGQDHLVLAQNMEAKYLSLTAEVSSTDIMAQTQPTEGFKFHDRGWR